MMLDKIIIEFDKIVKTLATNAVSSRVHPDDEVVEADLSEEERKHSLGLMRVNHCGEVCAQALYQGQALTSRSQAHKISFEQAAVEEVEHLAWTQRRIGELGGEVSVLNPLFYAGSLVLGITAGVIGDKWSLGFLEETERQVEAHLERHLIELPSNDVKSLAIVKQMKIEEGKHAQMAHDAGAIDLPKPVKNLMHLSSLCMTKTAYYI